MHVVYWNKEDEMKTYIISLGGSLIFPNEIDAVFLKRFREFILDQAKKGRKFVIICGGGAINREYNDALRKIMKPSDNDLDWLGIQATKMNAFFVRTLFGNNAYECVFDNPTKRIKTNKKVIVGSGWKPGWSTDLDSVLAAKTYNADMIINLTNVDYVYTKDPRKYKDAKIIKEISWKDFRKIVGNRWSPRLNAPFDPVAARMAQKNKARVIIANGKNLKNLKNILDGKKFKGTSIR